MVEALPISALNLSKDLTFVRELPWLKLRFHT